MSLNKHVCYVMLCYVMLKQLSLLSEETRNQIKELKNTLRKQLGDLQAFVQNNGTYTSFFTLIETMAPKLRHDLNVIRNEWT